VFYIKAKTGGIRFEQSDGSVLVGERSMQPPADAGKGFSNVGMGQEQVVEIGQQPGKLVLVQVVTGKPRSGGFERRSGHGGLVLDTFPGP
jgi:hypothetical protein